MKLVDVLSDIILNESIKDGVVTCDKCNWQWSISDGGKDPYLCHKCGHDNSLNEGLEDTSWTGSDGQKITLQQILDAIKDYPVVQAPIEKVEKIIIKKDSVGIESDRLSAADVKYPIIIVVDDSGGYRYVLDGNHRANKAIAAGLKSIPAKLVNIKKLPQEFQAVLGEDLRDWFKEKWVNIGKKVDGKHPPCGTSGKKKGYAKCVPAAKAAKMSKKEKESATNRKRKAQNAADRGGKDSAGQGKKPINVSTKAKNEEMNLEEKLNLFLERNCPNDPGKWSASKAAAKSKFDVYPSAYANGWAAKNYKSKGGTWKKCNEGTNALCEEEISPENEREMIEGIAEIVRGVKDITNRKELAKKQIKQLKSEGIKFDVKEFLSLCGFKNKEEEIDEYDVETIQEFQDFKQFIREYATLLTEGDCNCITEAEYRGRKVQLGKPMQGDVKKFKVYVKNPAGKVVKVNFGQKGMVIKKNNPKRRKSFRARMNCDNPGPRTKANYWSCRKW